MAEQVRGLTHAGAMSTAFWLASVKAADARIGDWAKDLVPGEGAWAQVQMGIEGDARDVLTTSSIKYYNFQANFLNFLADRVDDAEPMSKVTSGTLFHRRSRGCA